MDERKGPPEEEVAPRRFQGRGRFIGGQRRARGQRGRPAYPRAPVAYRQDRDPARHQLPSAAERAAQLGIPLPDAGANQPTPPTLEEISRRIEATFTSSLLNTDSLQSIIIDPRGYVDLCSSVYLTLFTNIHGFQRYLSQHEFLLCMMWMLIRRVLFVRAKIGFIDTELRDFMTNIPNFRIPSPIAKYLEGIGLIELPDKTKVLPDLIVAAGVLDADLNHDYRGMIPVRLSQWTRVAPNAVQLGMFGHMLPCGLIARHFHMYANQPVNANWMNMFNHTAGAQHAHDVYLARPNTLAFHGAIPPHADRIAMIPFANNYETNSFIGVACFTNEILTAYLNALFSIEKVMFSEQVSESSAGSTAQCAYSIIHSVPAHGPTRSIAYRSAVDLGPTERMAARLFRYRRHMHDDHCTDPNGADVAVAITLAPSLIRVSASLTITLVENIDTYLHYYVSQYVLKTHGVRV